jgi:hypothetical protein
MLGVEGMVQVAGITCRIVRLRHGYYEAVRILDDVRVGTFTTEPRLVVTGAAIEEPVMSLIARSALRSAKVTWDERLAVPKT